MRALIVTAPDELREAFRGVSITKLTKNTARLQPTDATTVEGATKFALRELARRVQSLNAEIKRVNDILGPLVVATAPKLVARPGIGTDTAAALLIAAGDNLERLHSRASFAHLCSSAPIGASSGLVTRKRLNPRGNRSANEALRRIVLVRIGKDPRTRIYVERRAAEGKTKRDIMRYLKGYVAREVYRDLNPIIEALDKQ